MTDRDKKAGIFHACLCGQVDNSADYLILTVLILLWS